MAQPQPPTTHFWTPGTGPHGRIAVLGRAGPGYDQEDIVTHAWSAILAEYFVKLLPANSPHVYTIGQQLYRGPTPGPRSAKKPDLVVVKMQTAMANPNPGQPPLMVSRDVLWVECKAPNHDTPSGWKDLMEQACGRLEEAHPNRTLFVIFGIGLKWMMFKWDPSAGANPNANVSPLQVLASTQAQAWTLPWKLRYDPNIPGQSHVVPWGNSPVADMIDTSTAYSLDYWTLYQGQILNRSALHLLERCIQHIAATNYQYDNPPEFQ